jgi:hypothetical protein
VTWRESRSSCTLPVVQHQERPAGARVSSKWLRASCRGGRAPTSGASTEMFSNDGGETWSLPAPSRFTSPNSPLSIKRVPGSGKLLAVWNPAPAYETRPLRATGGDRTPLVIATGDSSAGKWTAARIIDGIEDPPRVSPTPRSISRRTQCCSRTVQAERKDRQSPRAHSHPQDSVVGAALRLGAVRS